MAGPLLPLGALLVQGGRFALPRILGAGKEFIAKRGGLPYLTSGSRAMTVRRNTLPAVIGGGRSGLPAIRPLGSAVPSGAGSPMGPMQGPILPGSSVPSGVGGTGSLTIPGINRNLITATGINLAGAGLLAPSLMEQEAEISANQEAVPPFSPQDKNIQPAKPDEKKEDQASNTEKDIKKGELDDYIKQNMDIFDKYLGDGKEKTKAGLYNAMVQFGLNLAQSKGGNFADKIARSAKEPMQEFAKLGNALSERADKIKMAAVEQELKQEAEEREFEREKELTELEAAGGTDFQQNLATIRTLAPNLSNEDAIKLAKGIKIDDGVDGFIQKNIVSFMQQTDEDVETATKQLADIYNSSTALATAPTVSEADIANQPDGAPFKVEGRGEVFVKEGDQLRIVG